MKTSLIKFLSILLLICCIGYSQTTIIGGNVSGIWTTANSPYNIIGSITIPSDSTLIIEPGVTIEFQGHYSLNVQGRLLAIGTVNDSIKFTINDTTGFSNRDTTLGSWHGIRFFDTPAQNDTSKLIFCSLQYSKAFGSGWPDHSGGAIFISNFNKVLISNCLITNNSAGGLDSPSGGGLALAFANIKLVQNEISFNRAWDGGGLQIWESDPVFSNNTIISNISDVGGGGIWIGGASNPIFSGDIIANNVAGINGGGMNCWQTTNTSLNSVNIINNSASWGGGIGIINCEFDMNNCIVNENYASTLGGAIASDSSNLNIRNTTFTRDTSADLSGAIHSWKSNLNINQSTFVDNHSSFGGAIHTDYSILHIDTCTFNGNIATDGGAIHSSNTNLFIDSCLFYQNQASNSSGGIQYHIDTTDYINPYEIEITNSMFVENSAFYRGALEIRQFNSDLSLVNVRLDKCNFTYNSTDRGGNLMINGNIDDFTISKSVFMNNTAALRTATCLFSNNANGDVINCLFSGNITLGGGAATSLGTGAKIDFINCTFSNNNGGATLTFRNNAHAMLLNNLFWQNERSEIIVNALNDSTPCSLFINYCDIQNGLDSIVVNDTVSTIHWGIGNIDQDPLFVDTSNNNFHLQQNSPCLEAGIDSINISGNWYFTPLTDLDDNPRPYPSGTFPDLGAYEAQFPSDLGNEVDDIPIIFALYQNYPNPFNPQTIIRYNIPKLNYVELKLYNILGQLIKTLISENKPAGKYKYELNGSNLASGIYFLHMRAGKFNSKQKILLVK